MPKDILPIHGRRSQRMTEDDWANLASAYNTWRLAKASGYALSRDETDFLKSVFEANDLWDYEEDCPDIEGYRSLMLNRC